MTIRVLPQYVGRRTKYEDEGSPLYVTQSVDITSQCSNDVRSKRHHVRLDYTGTLIDFIAIVVVTKPDRLVPDETAFAFERLNANDEKLVEVAIAIGMPPHDLLELMKKQSNRR